MSVFKQGEKWWYEFYVDGKRFRSSTRTPDKAVAQLIESEHKRSLENGTGKTSPTLNAIRADEKAKRVDTIWEGFEIQKSPPNSAPRAQRKAPVAARTEPRPGMLLREAGELWLKTQRERRRAATIQGNEQQLRRLVEFFGNIRLVEFQIGHFEHYQSVRAQKCSPSTVNHELNTLARILRRVDLWDSIKKRYTPLKDREWKAPKIFTASEQERLFKKLKQNPSLDLGEIVFTITRNTTASGCELRGLRLRNLELQADPPRIHIPSDSTKNNIRPRTIPLNADALNAFKRAVERALKLGCHYPEHYLFPLRVNRALYDPTKPASKSWLRKQVAHLRELTGIEHLTPHTFRHLAVTELLEQGASEQTVIALAGWVGRKMIETYSHPRIEAKADAVKLLSTSGHKAPEPPAVKAAIPVPAPQPCIPDMAHPAIKAEIDRQVELALQSRRGRPGTLDSRVGRRRTMRRRKPFRSGEQRIPNPADPLQSALEMTPKVLGSPRV